MAKLPAVKVTKNGKHYFLVNGRKVFIESNMTKREMMSIYKLLLKKVRPKKSTTKNVNNSSAVIKQYFNHNPYRRRRRRTIRKDRKDGKDKKDKDDGKLKSTIDESKRVTVNSGNHPKDSGYWNI